MSEDTQNAAPPRAGLVLVALILVAGVANLNLSVANVALPDIGKHFDSSQTMLDLIAVGYSLGLAGTVLYLGALGDRYGRKMMLLLGLALSVPACLLAALAPSDVVLFGARVLGGVSAGMAYPTTLALIAALWSGPGRTKAIALWSALGGAIASLGPARRRRPARAVRLGLGVPHHAPAGGGRVPDGRALRARPRQRVDRTRGQPRRCPLDRPRRGADPRDQLRPGARQGRPGAGAGGDRRRRADRLRPSPAPREQSALRPARRVAPDLLGRGLRGHHRVRLADGRHVHQPAVPPERARRTPRSAPARRSCPRSSSWCSSRRARPSSSRRAAPASRCCAATCSCSSAFGTMLLLWKEGSPYWKIGLALHVHRGSASVSPARRRRTR